MNDDQHQEIVEYLQTALKALIKIKSELKRLDANQETMVCYYRARGAIGNALVALDASPYRSCCSGISTRSDLLLPHDRTPGAPTPSR
jgi:hypothetical protein